MTCDKGTYPMEPVTQSAVESLLEKIKSAGHDFDQKTELKRPLRELIRLQKFIDSVDDAIDRLYHNENLTEVDFAGFEIMVYGLNYIVESLRYIILEDYPESKEQVRRINCLRTSLDMWKSTVSYAYDKYDVFDSIPASNKIEATQRIIETKYLTCKSTPKTAAERFIESYKEITALPH